MTRISYTEMQVDFLIRTIAKIPYSEAVQAINILQSGVLESPKVAQSEEKKEDAPV